MIWLHESHQCLNSAVKVSVHHVCRADVNRRVAATVECECARVLEVATENRANSNILAKPFDARFQRTHSSNQNLNLNAVLRCNVKSVDYLFVNEGVDLDAHACILALFLEFDLFVDQVDKSVANTVRRYQEGSERGVGGIARELVEEAGEVFANGLARGEQAVVLIEASGLRVVVSGADVAVAAKRAALLANNERQFAVSLEPNNAVNNVNAGLLELASPGDVGLLVEASLDLNQRQDLLASLSRIDQRIDDWAVTACAIKGLLDCKHVWVGRCRSQECDNRCRERLVWVVHQNLALPDGRKDVDLLVFASVQVAVGNSRMNRVAQFWTVQECNFA